MSTNHQLGLNPQDDENVTSTADLAPPSPETQQVRGANTIVDDFLDQDDEIAIDPTHSPPPSHALPEIQAADLSLGLEEIIFPSNADVVKVQKRASNIMRLAQENEKLKAELKAMSDRVEAAERKQQELTRKQRSDGLVRS